MNTIECPECGKVLKTANPIAPGKKVRCPGCKAIFTMPAAKPASSAAVRTKSAPPPPRPSVEDDDERPRPKRRRRDEDDEDIDDRDEEEEDRPRKKKKKKKQAGPNWALIGGGAGGGLLVLILILGFLWPGFFLSGKGPGGGPAVARGSGQENLLAYMPKNGQIFLGIDATKNAEMAKALQEGLVAKIQQQMQQMPGAVGGIPPAISGGLDESLRDAQRFVVGIAPSGGQGTAAFAVSTSKPADVKQIVKAFNADKAAAKDHQGKPYYNLPDGPPGGPPLFIGLPNNRVLLFGLMPEEEFKGLLASNGQQVQISAEAQALVRSVDKSYLWGAVVIGGELNMQMFDAKMWPAELKPAAAAIKKLKGLSFSGDESPTKDQKITIALTCASDADSVVVTNSLNALWQKQGRPMLGMLGLMAAQPGNEGLGDFVNDVSKTLKIESDGAVAQASVSIREQTMKKMEKMQGQMLQNFGGMGPGGPPPGAVPKKRGPGGQPGGEAKAPSNTEVEQAVRTHVLGNQQAGFQLGVPAGGKVQNVSDVKVEKSIGDAYHIVKVKVDYQAGTRRGSVTRTVDVRLDRSNAGWVVESLGR